MTFKEESMTDADQKCEVCGGESGGRPVGVAAVPGAPTSIAWCSECLARDCAPRWIFDHDFVHVAGGDVEALNEWARSRQTWVDGRYVTFDEYVKRITPEMVATQIAEFEAAATAGSRYAHQIHDVCELLHMSANGSSDPISDEKRDALRSWLSRRLEEWRQPTSEYDAAFKALIEATLAEHVESTDSEEQTARRP